MASATALHVQGLLNSVDKLSDESALSVLSTIHPLLTELSQSEEVSFVEWLFGLSREFFVASKPLSTMVLSGAVETALFFMEPNKILHQTRRSNPPGLEALIWIELMSRARCGRLSLGSVWRIAVNFRSDDLRREFLFWFSKQRNVCELATLLNLRSHLALKLEREKSGHRAELEIIDEAIKLRIVTSSNKEIRRLCTEIASRPIPMLPKYLWPMCEKLFPLKP